MSDGKGDVAVSPGHRSLLPHLPLPTLMLAHSLWMECATVFYRERVCTRALGRSREMGGGILCLPSLSPPPLWPSPAVEDKSRGGSIPLLPGVASSGQHKKGDKRWHGHFHHVIMEFSHPNMGLWPASARQDQPQLEQNPFPRWIWPSSPSLMLVFSPLSRVQLRKWCHPPPSSSGQKHWEASLAPQLLATHHPHRGQDLSICPPKKTPHLPLSPPPTTGVHIATMLTWLTAQPPSHLGSVPSSPS